MAAGDAFTIVPTLVKTSAPVYNVETTQSESMKKEYFELAGTPMEIFTLEFSGKTHAEKQAILDHYNDQSGGFQSFSWQSVPSYVGGGANMTGRWVSKSYMESPVSQHWNVTLKFEKEV